VLAIALTATGCGAKHAAPPRSGERLVDLRSTDQLRSQFAADYGHPRLLLLLSPT
jgi:hypothetical protein